MPSHCSHLCNCQQGECLIFRNLGRCSVPPSPFPRSFSEHSLALFLPHSLVPAICVRGRMKHLFGTRKDKVSKERCFTGPCGGVPSMVKMCCSHPEWSHLHFLVLFTLPLGNFSSSISRSLFIQVELLGAVCTDCPQAWPNPLGSWNDTGLGLQPGPASWGLSQCDSRELGWLSEQSKYCP